MLRRTALLAALVLSAQVPGAAPLSAHPNQGRLDDVQAELRQKRQQLRTAHAREQGLLGRVAASDARRDQLSTRIGDLALALTRATAGLEVSRAALVASRSDLRTWRRRLASLERDLAGRRERLGHRAATAYRLGAGGYLDLILGADSLRTLTDRMEFVDKVLVADSDLIASVDVQAGLVQDHRTRVAGLREMLTQRAQSLEREIVRITAMKAQQEALRAQVEREIAVHTTLVGKVQSEKAAYRRAVKDLQAESDRIQGLIEGGGSSGSGSGQLSWPTAGPVVSGFGWRTHPIYGTRRFHAGIDIDGECGQRISAAAGGRVLSSGWSGGYGKTIVIDHGDGLSTLYAHQSKLQVSAGEQVARGQRIGSVGTTGWSTGCHLHFEVRVNGEPVDPMPYL